MDYKSKYLKYKKKYIYLKGGSKSLILQNKITFHNGKYTGSIVDSNSAIRGSGGYNKYGLYDGNGYARNSRSDSEFKNGVKIAFF